MSDKKFEVGQQVKVFDVNNRRMGQPDSGWNGEIIKVARTRVTIQYGREEDRPFNDPFSMADQRICDNYGHRNFLLREDAELKDRIESARQVLHKSGLRLDVGPVDIPVEKLEAIAKILEEDQ